MAQTEFERQKRKTNNSFTESRLLVWDDIIYNYVMKSEVVNVNISKSDNPANPGSTK